MFWGPLGYNGSSLWATMLMEKLPRAGAGSLGSGDLESTTSQSSPGAAKRLVPAGDRSLGGCSFCVVGRGQTSTIRVHRDNCNSVASLFKSGSRALEEEFPK